MTTLRRTLLFGFAATAVGIGIAGAAWACSPAITMDPILPAGGPPGQPVTVTAKGATASVEVHWERDTGPILATATGPDVSITVNAPTDAAPGLYYIVVAGYNAQHEVQGQAYETFRVDPGPPYRPADAQSAVVSDPDPRTGSTAGDTGLNSGVQHADDPVVGPAGPGPAPTAPVTSPVGEVPSPASFGPPGSFGLRAVTVGTPGLPSSATGTVALAPSGANAAQAAGADGATAKRPDGGFIAGAAIPGAPPGAPAVANGAGAPGASAAPGSVRSALGDLWSGFSSGALPAARRANPASLDGGAPSSTGHGAMSLGVGLLSLGLVISFSGAAVARGRRRRALASSASSR